MEDLYDTVSDHSTIILTMSENVIKKTQPVQLANRHTDWEAFRKELDQTIKLRISLITKDQLDEEAEQFVTNIQNATWNNTSNMQCRKLQRYNYHKEIRDLVREKCKTRKIWQRTRAPEDKTKVNRLTQQFRRILFELKNERIDSYILENSQQTKTQVTSCEK